MERVRALGMNKLGRLCAASRQRAVEPSPEMQGPCHSSPAETPSKLRVFEAGRVGRVGGHLGLLTYGVNTNDTARKVHQKISLRVG